MGINEKSRISIQLESAPKDRPGVFHNTNSFVFNGNSIRSKPWELFHKLPENKLVLAHTINTNNGKIFVNGQSVTAVIMEIDQPITPMIFAVQRIAPDDEMLVQYPFPENGSEPKIVHPSFLAEPTYYYHIEPDENSRFNYRLKFWDTTPRRISFKKQGN